ncbi:RecQ family ATP-dependent DNA helicase [Pseudomonas luteola]|uniref:RecQ family ATP-dependent DNA helicase n=1 Tax=Pseudomonas luteola TaxID=47886 RepID=UPI001EF59628|nr:RecQ family ATP-dependent DNA helicase [Pseudomonas luteola]MCG7373993.1 RecQ family ATP-dependent DNA helicase [Pseudomonas luteola]
MAVLFPKPGCLVFDLEVIPTQDGKPEQIYKLGALRADTGSTIELDVRQDPRPALEQLDVLGDGAEFVLGHNIVKHDLSILKATQLPLRLLDLPVIDTLHLSPITFPQNPYHRLIKDYKLVRDSLNSPLSDCRSTLTLFQDQQEALERLKTLNPKELLCYQILLRDEQGALGQLFQAITGDRPLPLAELQTLLPDLLRENDPTLERDLKVCRTRLKRLISTELGDPTLRWPLAYALAWLRVSGGNSVLAPWVRYQFPRVRELIHELRDIPCNHEDCLYCKTTHDPRHELQRYFGFDDFRLDNDGVPRQHDCVAAGMRGENVLAVLATGGGKSLCYQLPALNRFHRNGSLTIIVSPLQSLMKDQVDGLLARNIQCAATLNGLLTMPERADVLEKIQLGDVGILLVSPEQFRNKAFRRAIKHRQIGAWIFDEAHCLSKWGNDFRPDYLYAARFIKDHTGNEPLAPIGCFTATGKPDVLDDIRQHFKKELDVTFKDVIGKPERTNLSFDVLPCGKGEKWPRTHHLLEDMLGTQEGGAVVFVSSRKSAEELAEFLKSQTWACEHFHAGLQPNEKKDIQDSFKDGRLRVIVATNAFGMGVDKSDIRLVIHAEIPGSLENYLQEAGRAGRDQNEARCVLLYEPQDIETQFGLCERSKLSIRDIQQILKKLKTEHSSRKGNQLVITAGEILLDDSVDTSFAAEDLDAETKVATAIAWLERGEFLKREENRTQIFPARLGLKAEEAESRLLKANLPARRLEEFRSILRFLYEAGADQRINTDQLMALTSQTQEEVAGTLKQMEDMGLLVNDSQLTLYVRHGIVGASNVRLKNTLKLEEALFGLLREQSPDAENGSWQDLNLPALTATLRSSLEQSDLLPIHVLRLLRSLAQDRDGESSQRSSFEIKQINRDYLKLRIKNGHTWGQLEKLGHKRRVISTLMLDFFISKLPPGERRKDLLVETTFGELVSLIENDLYLKSEVSAAQRRKAVEHVLLYLHQQEVITLNHGMTVMRRAMTIEMGTPKKNSYTKDDYQKLDEHYREKRIQVHVMREYAEVALQKMSGALELVLDYFALPKDDFIKRYFKGREDVLKLATSEESWKSIVQDLNTYQKLIVADNEDRNRLVLAGPGSGKTRVIVHRIAYLLRVRRVSPNCIIALTFNRHAATEIRKRLIALVGPQAYGLTILTYHSMAMRLTGTRFERGESVTEEALSRVLHNAVELLEGKGTAGGEDDLRERLLRGYRYILVDEYQDIDDWQYRLVSALAGRHAEEDGKLCILAVGDDDQNIYAWRSTNNEYIQRFRDDYSADISYLIENYRSTQRVISAANCLIEQNLERLKAEHPIRIDKKRQNEPAGGDWEARDPERQGRVLRIQLPETDWNKWNLQAQATTSELKRLLSMSSEGWHHCAVLARNHRMLWPLQAWCEEQEVPYFLAADKENMLPLIRQRGFVGGIEKLRKAEGTLTTETLAMLFAKGEPLEEGWPEFFETALSELKGELGECSLASNAIIDWLYDYARELRQQPRQGLYLGTVHSAKGLEFRHVVLLDGGWLSEAKTLADERRLYYVGMTRAQETLTLCEYAMGNPFSHTLTDNAITQEYSGRHDELLDKHYKQLNLSEIDIGFAGRFHENATIHKDIGELKIGDPLNILSADGCYHLTNQHGRIVGRTARSFKMDFVQERCEVAGIIARYSSDNKDNYQSKCAQWEVIVPRLAGYRQS